MNILTIVLLMILIMLSEGALCIACFFIGAKVGQKVNKGEDLYLPNLDPIKAHQERQERKTTEAMLKRDNVVLENIENYNGTSIGQKDVPR